MADQNSPLKVVFAGTPEFASGILQQLADSEFVPIAVFTQPDRPHGRNRKLRPGPVKQLAVRLGLPVHQPESLRRPEAANLLTSYQPDVLAVAAYGLILPPSILAIPRYGCLNVHASLLPRWRGAAPIERAIMAGDPETGVCIMRMEKGLDTGPVYARASVPIADPADPATLEHDLACLGGKLLIGVLQDFARHHHDGALPPMADPQGELGITYADKLNATDREVDWSQSPDLIARQVNALSQRMPVRCQLQGTGVQLLQAVPAPSNDLPAGTPGMLVAATKSGLFVRCATGALQVLKVRVERGKGTALDASAALNGFSELFTVGTVLERAG